MQRRYARTDTRTVLAGGATMTGMNADVRERLSRLVDCLPDAELLAVKRSLEDRTTHGDSLTMAALWAPEDADELSGNGRRLPNEGLDDPSAGRTHTLDEVKREIAL